MDSDLSLLDLNNFRKWQKDCTVLTCGGDKAQCETIGVEDAIADANGCQEAGVKSRFQCQSPCWRNLFGWDIALGTGLQKCLPIAQVLLVQRDEQSIIKLQ